MDSDLNIWVNNNPHEKKTEAKPHSDAILQQLLQNKLNTSQSVNIYKNSNGKPYAQENIYFSHANSHNLYAYIVSNKHEVSIDVEFIKLNKNRMKLADRYFHPDEVRLLKSLEASQRVTEFYKLWTKKEAWCKLEGGNLWSYLARSVLPNNPIKTSEGTHIYIKNNHQIRGFACAVASTSNINNIWINNLGSQCTD